MTTTVTDLKSLLLSTKVEDVSPPTSDVHLLSTEDTITDGLKVFKGYSPLHYYCY